MIAISQEKLTQANGYLLILFAFVLPLSVAITNIVGGLILLIWLFRARFKQDWYELRSNPFIWAVLIFYALHVVGLIWTEDMQWGLHILKKETKFLLIPIFMLFVKKEHIRYYILAFLSAMTLSEMLSYGVWFEVIPEFKRASVENPTPFMSHVSYNPFLCIAIYLLIVEVLFGDSLSNARRCLYLFFIITMSINMFITGGRAGQVMFFVMIVMVLFQYFNRQWFKALVFTLIFIPTVFTLAYEFSSIFKQRIHEGIYAIKAYETDQNTSIGERLTFWKNSFDIIKQHPIIGVGTGDFKEEYRRINEKNSPHTPHTVNPHNMYILELVQFGLVGLLSLLSLFYYQIRHAMRCKDQQLRYIGITLPLLFMVIMLSDSYLLGHYTGMLFVFFSSFLYKNFDTRIAK